MLLLAMGTNQYVEATGKIIKKKLATGGLVAGAAGATGFAGGFLTGAAVASHLHKTHGGFGGYSGRGEDLQKDYGQVHIHSHHHHHDHLPVPFKPIHEGIGLAGHGYEGLKHDVGYQGGYDGSFGGGYGSGYASGYNKGLGLIGGHGYGGNLGYGGGYGKDLEGSGFDVIGVKSALGGGTNGGYRGAPAGAFN